MRLRLATDEPLLGARVGSPELPAARCRSVEQMRLANGLCRYVELAAAIPSAK